MVCCILTTAEYCAETVDKMQEKLKKMVSAEFHNKVSPDKRINLNLNGMTIYCLFRLI